MPIATGGVALVAVFAGVFGLLIGSFLNVVVYRVPAGMSVVRPASACPRCHREIRGFDNIPVISWLVLRGRCRDCDEPISARYPIVELATGVLFAAVALALAPARNPFVAPSTGHAPASLVLLVALLYLMAISVALALIDVDTHTLPNAIVLPSYIVLVVLLGVVSGLTGDWGAFVRGLLGLAILGAFYLVLAIAVPGGMGFGDVKLAGVLGFVLAYLGWGPLAVGAFAAFVLGGTFALVLIAIRKRPRGIPFGPWMLAGAWIGALAGHSVLDWYFSLLGLA